MSNDSELDSESVQAAITLGFMILESKFGASEDGTIEELFKTKFKNMINSENPFKAIATFSSELSALQKGMETGGAGMQTTYEIVNLVNLLFGSMATLEDMLMEEGKPSKYAR